MQLLIFSLLLVYTVIMYADIFIFMVKSAPKVALFGRGYWFLSFLTGGAAVYFYLNGYKF